MKNCQFCQAELADDAVFCSKCGNRQVEVAQDQAATPEVAAVPEPAAAPEPPAAPPPAPQDLASPGHPPYPYPHPPQAHPYPPQAPAPPSALALEGRRYFTWLGKGFLGTEEPMHMLFAAIVPFLITLFYTLASSKLFNWHAGGFFLSWFFNMILMVLMPTATWVCRRYWLKDEISLPDAFARFSSLMNLVLPITLFVMLLGLVISVNSAGGLNFLTMILHLIPLLIFAASLIICLSGPRPGIRKIWMIVLALTLVYLIFFSINSLILSAAARWGWGGY